MNEPRPRQSTDADPRLLETQPIILPSWGDVIISDPHNGDLPLLVIGVSEDGDSVNAMPIAEKDGVIVPIGMGAGTVRIDDIDRPFKGYLSRIDTARVMARSLMPEGQINEERFAQILEDNPEQ